MGRKFIEILTCDRTSCGREFSVAGRLTIGDLSYMRQRNGSGTMNRNMSLILYPECTVEFLQFMEGEQS